MLIPTVALKDDSEMWSKYLEEVNEEDIREVDAWKEYANSILTFVSLTTIYWSLCSSQGQAPRRV